MEFHPCAIIPTYNNPQTLRSVVERVGQYISSIIIVDDGSDPPGREVANQIQQAGLAHVVYRPHNGGKGAAVKTGFQVAGDQGFSHALQIDADGQHALADIPKFLQAASKYPDALILGTPRYNTSAPTSRIIGRKISQFWTRVETGGHRIQDPMCGFRVYPLAAVMKLGRMGNRMDFDIEISVRMVWNDVEVINVPTEVHYLAPSDGGISHFQLFWDNLRIGWLHTRLSCTAILLHPWRHLAKRIRKRLFS